MGWFDNDYDYDYQYRGRSGWNRGSTASGYRQGGRDQGGTAWGSGYNRNQGYGTSRGYGSGAGYGTSYGYGAQRGYGNTRYGYDYQVRRSPQESPLYGDSGDQGVQRWAQRYGYDMGYQIQPRNQGGGGGGRGMGRAYDNFIRRGYDDGWNLW